MGYIVGTSHCHSHSFEDIHCMDRAANDAVDQIPDSTTNSLAPTGEAHIDPASSTTWVDQPALELDEPLSLPTLIVPHTLLLPHMSLPYPIDGEEEGLVIDNGMEHDRHVLVLAATDQVEEFDTDDYLDEELDGDSEGTDNYGLSLKDDEICKIGVIAEIGHRIARPGVPSHVILQGIARGIVREFDQREPYTLSIVEQWDDPTVESLQSKALIANVMDQIESYVSMLPNIPDEVVTMVRSVDEPGWLADLIAFSPEFGPALRQELLEILDPVERLTKISGILQERLEFLALRQQIQSEAQAGMDRQQREMMLREQLRTIQRELGELSSEDEMVTEFREKIEAAGMPEEVEAKATFQLNRLEQQHPFSPEIGVIQTYLEWLTELPWSVETEDQVDLDTASAILDEDHYGLEKVKERILEFLAVRKLAGDKMRSPILCFVGPPGVGKTSLGKSIARALGRNYSRMSLGGVRDEAEIRGHRRTYVGAMPGRIIKAIRDAKSRNPVIVLDEIDKVGSDTFRGDPSSALLEVLDPEQNNTFSDHYLEVPFDLSKIVFVTTANMLEPIPPALRDRMEIIEVPSYTEVDKMQIARGFLIPKSLESHGLEPEQIDISDDALLAVIREYTYEAGVRNLEREISSLCRKVARQVAADESVEVPIESAQTVEEMLGIPRYEFGLANDEDQVGVATGAAVTGAGGDLLSIEVTIMEGKGNLLLTGKLGDVMQESARAALSHAQAIAGKIGIPQDFFDNHIIHIHVPAGAVPKDGPSAGVTIATALISALTNVPVRCNIAMTGEITLRGKVLPVGGVREKALAARRGGITRFLIPKRNEKDLVEIPDSVREELDIQLIEHVDEAFEIALVSSPYAVESLAG